MPRAPKYCGAPGCTTLVPVGTRCTVHQNRWRGAQTASSKAAGTRQWREVRARILERDHHMCQIRTPGICTQVATTVDKIIPAARRADLAYTHTNLRAACAPCNQHKASTTDRCR
jgi:5-methylcytosine-specific restriction enzyme A